MPTPDIRIAELDVLPRITINEWLNHTSQMLIYDWAPITYFIIAALIAPKDSIGCSQFGIETLNDLLYMVYMPVLILRFIGVSFFMKREYILPQILVIYGYQLISLTIWEVKNMQEMR